MPGNSFGQLFKITTFGESHGPAIGVVIDGVPSGIPLTLADIQFELNRRRPGQSSVTTPRNETDEAEIVSGLFEGRTTGTPLTILIHNKNQKSTDYNDIKNIYRPGHADFTYTMKYGFRDYRGGGRSSGRETAGRVAAGAVAKKILREHGINIVAYTLAIADVRAKKIDYSVIEKNIVRAPDMEAAEEMIKRIEDARACQNSVGGLIEAVAHGCPAGLGEPVFDKLNARLGQAILSIGAVRGVEFGEGFGAAKMSGSEHNDQFFMDGESIRHRTNHNGGISGGISNGENIALRLAVKPTSSIARPQHTVTQNKEGASIEVQGRHDPCICPRIVPVVEAMIALTLTDFLMLQKSMG